MDRIYTVVRQTMLLASIEQAWRHLVDGPLLTKWFAASGDLGPGSPFHFAFGDGDFFSGFVTAWDPPVSLQLEWKFLGVGPSFDVQFSLLPVEEETELTVRDHGAASIKEAAGLREGWEDFLSRCAKTVRTGENSRYRWTELFGGTAFIRDKAALWASLTEPESWRAFFPGTEIGIQANAPERLSVEFRDPAWNGLRTNGQVRLSSRKGQACLQATHGGWSSLPTVLQVEERARYASAWTRLLQEIETQSFAVGRD